MGSEPSSERSAPLQEIRLGDRTFWSLAAIAFLVRLAVFWVNLSHAQPVTIAPDSESYIQTGESLAFRGGIVGDDGQPVLGRPPGYPAFLAFTFLTGLSTPDRLTGALVLQLMVSALIVALAGRMASVFGGRRFGLLTGAMLAIEPSGVSYSNLVVSETLYTCVLLAAALAFWRWVTGPGPLPLMGFAALVALLPLIRPVGLYLPWLLGGIVSFCAPRSWRLKSAALFLAIALLPTAAWTARNWRHFGVAVFHRTGPYGQALFAWQVELRASNQDIPEGPEMGSEHPWQRYYDERGPLPMPQAMARQEEYFRETLKAHPVAAFQEWLFTGATIVGAPNSLLQAQLTGQPVSFGDGSVATRLRWLAGTGPLLPVILLGLVLSVGGVACLPIVAWQSRAWPPPRRSFAILVIAVIAFHLVVSAFVRWQSDRYRAPIEPFLATLLLVGTYGLAIAARRRALAGARALGAPSERVP